MKKYIILVLGLCLLISCSEYHIKKEIKNGSALSKLKNSGIIIRKTNDTSISMKLFYKNLTQWLEPYIKVNKLKLLTDVSKNLNIAQGESDRFLQFSNKNDFQYYQTVGIIKGYLNKNKEEFDKIRNDNNLDSFIIYEVGGSLSAELQFFDFSSMVIIIDNKNEVLYMDHQFDKYETYEFYKEILTEDLLDHISNRFLELMFKLDYLQEK
jgi:hypothetical protein